MHIKKIFYNFIRFFSLSLMLISKLNADISILTLNCYCFPADVTTILSTLNIRNLQSGILQSVEQRIPKIASFVKQQNPDIVCFQELWQDDNKIQMINELKDRYPYSFYTHRDINDDLPKILPHLGDIQDYINTGEVKLLDSGLLIFSKFPFQFAEEITYNQSFEEDGIARKGAIIIGIRDKNGTPIILANTHLQSGTSLAAINIKLDQLKQLGQRIQELKKISGFENAQIFVVGDLNEPILYQAANKRFIDRTNILYKALNNAGINVSNKQILNKLITKYGIGEIIYVDEPNKIGIVTDISGKQIGNPLSGDNPIIKRYDNSYTDRTPISYFADSSETHGTQLLDQFFTDNKNTLVSYQNFRKEILGDQGPSKPSDPNIMLSDHAALMATFKTNTALKTTAIKKLAMR